MAMPGAGCLHKQAGILHYVGSSLRLEDKEECQLSEQNSQRKHFENFGNAIYPCNNNGDNHHSVEMLTVTYDLGF